VNLNPINNGSTLCDSSFLVIPPPLVLQYHSLRLQPSSDPAPPSVSQESPFFFSQSIVICTKKVDFLPPQLSLLASKYHRTSCSSPRNNFPLYQFPPFSFTRYLIEYPLSKMSGFSPLYTFVSSSFSHKGDLVPFRCTHLIAFFDITLNPVFLPPPQCYRFHLYSELLLLWLKPILPLMVPFFFFPLPRKMCVLQ